MIPTVTLRAAILMIALRPVHAAGRSLTAFGYWLVSL